MERSTVTTNPARFIAIGVPISSTITPRFAGVTMSLLWILSAASR